MRSLLGLFWFALLCLTGCSSKAPPVPIYFGHLAPRSGPQRDYGLDTEKAILLAVEAARAEEQVLDRPVAFVHPDAVGDADTVQSIAVRLLTINNAVGLIGGPDAAIEERLCRIGQQYKVPVITPVWLPTQLLGAYGFSLGPVPTDQGKALALCAADKLGAKRVAVIIDNRSAASIALADAFADTIGKAAVVYRNEYAAADKLADLAKQATAADPTAILLAGSRSDLEKLRAELHQAGLKEKVPLLFGGPDDGSLSTLADRWAGSTPLCWSTVFVGDGRQPKAQEFVRQYEKRFGQPPAAAAALAYDAANLLFEAIRRAKQTRGDKVHDELATLQDFEGLTGLITFDKNQAVGRPVYVVQRQDRQLKVVGEPAAKSEKPAAK